jgi:ACS family D-galactonate transporter-like MFS transporter
MPQHHRGLANALIDAGAKVGPAAGTFIGGILLIHFGWRILFFIVGAAALLWLIPWVKLMPRPRPDQPRTSEFIPPTSELLGVPSAWGTFLGHFCGNYFFYFQLTWLPIYLVRERNLSVAAMTRLTSGLFLGIACATVVAGWISDRLIRHGFSPTQSRKSIAVGGLLVASTLIAFAFISSPTGSLAVLIVASLGYGAYSSNHWAIGQTLAGPTMAGRWGSVQNGVGNLAGIVAPSVAGFVVQTTGSSRMAFLVTGIIALAGALIWQFMVPRIEPVVWKKQILPQPESKYTGDIGSIPG